MRFPNRILLLVGIFFSCVELFAQKTPSKMFCKLSGPEKAWVIFHPFIAKKTWKITEQARMETKSLLLDPRLDGDEDGGQLDAFRHAFWMASLSQKICWRKMVQSKVYSVCFGCRLLVRKYAGEKRSNWVLHMKKAITENLKSICLKTIA